MNSKNARPKNSRAAVVETIKPLSKGKVVTGKKAKAPKKKKVVEQGRTLEASTVREKAKGTAKALGVKKTDNAVTLLIKAMDAKRAYYHAKAVEGTKKEIEAAAHTLDSAVAKFGKAVGITDLSINAAKQLAREWDCFDAK